MCRVEGLLAGCHLSSTPTMRMILNLSKFESHASIALWEEGTWRYKCGVAMGTARGVRGYGARGMGVRCEGYGGTVRGVRWYGTKGTVVWYEGHWYGT